jgi:non-heme chloroperoxidase
VPSFDANSVTLYYEQQGTGESVVFVHGTICDHSVWKSQVDAFSSEFKTIAYSRRYAYPNNRQGDIMDSTVQNNSDDLLALIEGLVGGRVHLIGHSYGGSIALYFALKHPEKLRSLTLCNAAVATMLIKRQSAAAMLSLLLKSPRVAMSARRLVNASDASVKGVEGGDSSAPMRLFVPVLLDNRNDLPPKPADFEQMVTRNARTLRETWAPLPPVARTEVGTLQVPALVIWGELSAPWDFRISQMLAESIPSAEKVIVPGTSHFFLLEKPAEANNAMLGFLRKHRAG